MEWDEGWDGDGIWDGDGMIYGIGDRMKYRMGDGVRDNKGSTSNVRWYTCQH